jgi:hypothetical protein
LQQAPVLNKWHVKVAVDVKYLVVKLQLFKAVEENLHDAGIILIILESNGFRYMWAVHVC